jgi:flagellar hook-basal body complex protein FliE
MSDPIGAAARIAAQQQLGMDTGARQVPVLTEPSGSSFGDTLKSALNEVSSAQDNAADYVGKFMRGEPVELHQVMAATEEAGIALDMLIEVRNKFADAYRSVINMQS